MTVFKQNFGVLISELTTTLSFLCLFAVSKDNLCYANNTFQALITIFSVEWLEIVFENYFFQENGLTLFVLLLPLW